jgi:hypothetical protein
MMNASGGLGDPGLAACPSVRGDADWRTAAAVGARWVSSVEWSWRASTGRLSRLRSSPLLRMPQTYAHAARPRNCIYMRPSSRAPADQPRIRDGVMRGATRAGRDHVGELRTPFWGHPAGHGENAFLTLETPLTSRQRLMASCLVASPSPAVH